MDKNQIKHPIISKLVEMLPDFPKFVAERSRFLLAKPEFQRRVWEKALLDAGIIGPNPRIRFVRDPESKQQKDS